MWKWIVLAGCLWSTETLARQGSPVVISEIMGDPIPSVGLPTEEFVELTNVSDTRVDLSGWILTNGRTRAQLPEGSWLEPKGILILCAASVVNQFDTFGFTIGLARFPVIANTGDTIQLYTAGGVLLHAVVYDPGLLGTEKQNGGWSLELIDTSKTCRTKGNWKVSTDPAGGSPGKPNSVLGEIPGESGIEPVHAWAFNENTLRLVFSDAVNLEDAVLPHNYRLPAEIKITNCSVLAPLFIEVELSVHPGIQPGLMYSLSAPGVGTCEAEAGEGGSLRELRIGMAGNTASGLILNEILFDPPAGGADFVELYHNGTTALNLARIQIANRNRTGELGSIRSISTGTRFMYPGDYLALTTNASWLISNYHVKEPTTVLQLPSLPSFPNQSGNVVLLENNSNIVDELGYQASWHHPMARNKKGISLERIRQDVTTQLAENWTSAAMDAGYATPGYQNSQVYEEQDNNRFFLDNGWFSPDGDGLLDDCRIHYELKQSGYLSSIRIFNRQGMLQRILVNNVICALQGTFTWNGMDAQGRLLPNGLYILVIDTWHISGKTKRYRLAVTLAKR